MKTDNVEKTEKTGKNGKKYLFIANFAHALLVLTNLSILFFIISRDFLPVIKSK